MERAIGLPYEEALFLDDVDAEAQAYWFTEPEGEAQQVQGPPPPPLLPGLPAWASRFGVTWPACQRSATPLLEREAG